MKAINAHLRIGTFGRCNNKEDSAPDEEEEEEEEEN